MSDRRPAKVRVYSDNGRSGAAPPATDADAAAPAARGSTPQRRRTDPGYTGKEGASGGMSGLLLLILFVLGAAGGGALSVALNLVEMPIQ